MYGYCKRCEQRVWRCDCNKSTRARLYVENDPYDPAERLHGAAAAHDEEED